MHQKLFAIWATLILYLSAAAQEKMGSFMGYGPEVKYFSNLNYRVYQSNNGYLWFGTLNGLVRFDGKRYKNYFSNYADSNSPTDNSIFDITADKNDDLWFAGFRNGATKYNQRTGRFTKYPGLSNDDDQPCGVNRIVNDSEGNLWFATSNSGVAKYDFEKDRFDFFFPDPGRSKSGTSVDGNHVKDIEEDTGDKNILWVGTFNGLYSFDKTKKTFYHYPERIQSYGRTDISSLEQDKNGFIWLGTWGEGLKCFDKNKKEFIENKRLKKVIVVYDIASVNDSIIYAACLDEGLYQLNTNTGEFINITPPRNPSDPTAQIPSLQKVSVTKDAGIFIGGYYYVYQQHPAFTRLKSNISYPFSRKKIGYISLTSFVWDEKRQLFWLATIDANGLYTLNKNATIAEPLAYEETIHQDNEYFHDMVLDGLNRPWVINYNNGINVWNDQKKKFVRQAGTIPLPDAKTKNMRSLKTNKDGNLWMTSDSDFIFLDVKKNMAETYPISWDSSYSGTHDLRNSELKADPEGNAWLFSKAGMFYCNRQLKKVKHIFRAGTNKSSLATRQTWSGVFGKNDDLWIINGNGIQVYNWRNDSVMVNYNIESGLPSMQVSSIEFDTTGRVWAGAASGLCFFDPSKKIWQQFNRMDGLAKDYLDANIFITTNNKIAVDQINGFLLKDVNDLLPPAQIPILRVTSVYINHEEYKDSLLPEFIKGLTFPYDQNNIDIEFAAMDWLYPSKVTYYSKVQGLTADSTWVANPDSRLSLIALQPGKYVLHIKALNANNTWSKEILFPITIKPPFWKTAWFIALCVIAMLFVLYALYRNRIGQLRKMLQVRNIISRDLHDEIGATLSSVNMLSTVALLKAGDKNEATTLLQQIKNSVQRAGESIDDIVWSVNPANDMAEDTFARIRKYVTELAEAKGLNCVIEIDDPGASLNLPMELRRDIYMVCKEAVNNVLKYSACKTIRLTIRLKNHNLIMTVADDGIGFDPAILQTSLRNGIGNMRHRTERHKGVFELVSAKGCGTTIVCKMQL